MLITHSTYKFKLSDRDYINTLVSLVGHLNIHVTIPHFPRFTDKKIKDLPRLLEAIRVQRENQNNIADMEFKLISVYRITDSLKNVLPRFLPQAPSNAPTILSAASIIDGRIRRETYNNEEGTLENTELPGLTQAQALQALNVAYREAPFRSAIALPSERSILVLTKCNKPLRLRYGSKKSSIGHGPEIGFNVDDGFWGEGVPLELKEASDQWIANGRKGAVFENPIMCLVMLEDAARLQASIKAQRYQAKSSPNRTGAIAFGVVTGLLYLVGSYTWPAMLALGGTAFLCTRMFSLMQAQVASAVTREFCESKKYKELSTDEHEAFRAGVFAAHSNRDMLSAWKNKQTFIYHDVYVAGRTLEENHAPKVRKILNSPR